MHVISYDISNDKLRNQIAKKLEGYGHRVQYSVFECRLKEKQWKRLYKELMELMKEQKGEGNIRIYTLCENCTGKRVILGETERVCDFSHCAEEPVIIV